METEVIDKLFLELSQFTRTKTAKELKKDAQIKTLREALRRTLVWGECCSARLTGEQRGKLNYRDLQYARMILSANVTGEPPPGGGRLDQLVRRLDT